MSNAAIGPFSTVLLVAKELKAVVRFRTVFCDIQTLEFFFLADTKAEHGLDDCHQYVTCAECPGEKDAYADELYAKLGKSAAVEQTTISIKETAGKSTPCTADTVDRRGTNGIIDLEHLVDELDGQDNQQTSEHTDNDGA